MTATPGDTTDFEFVLNDILELHKKFNFRELGVDRAKIPDMMQRLEKSGLKITEVQQGFRLSPAIRRTEKLLQEKRFCTYGHPVFKWCASNVALRIGALKGEAQFEKEKSREKIDAAVAAAIGVMVEMAQPQQAIASANPDAYKVRMVDRKI